MGNGHTQKDNQVNPKLIIGGVCLLFLALICGGAGIILSKLNKDKSNANVESSYQIGGAELSDEAIIVKEDPKEKMMTAIQANEASISTFAENAMDAKEVSLQNKVIVTEIQSALGNQKGTIEDLVVLNTALDERVKLLEEEIQSLKKKKVVKTYKRKTTTVKKPIVIPFPYVVDSVEIWNGSTIAVIGNDKVRLGENFNGWKLIDASYPRTATFKHGQSNTVKTFRVN